MWWMNSRLEAQMTVMNGSSGAELLGYWQKPTVSSCSGVIAATLSRQRSTVAQKRSRARSADGVKSTSRSGARRSPNVHSQVPAKSRCRCPSRQAIVVTGVGSGISGCVVEHPLARAERLW